MLSRIIRKPNYYRSKDIRDQIGYGSACWVYKKQSMLSNFDNCKVDLWVDFLVFSETHFIHIKGHWSRFNSQAW